MGLRDKQRLMNPSKQEMPKENLVDELMTVKPPSQIPLEKPPLPEKIEVNLTNYSGIYWSQISQELLNSYHQGRNFGKFGNNKKEIELFMNRFGSALVDSFKNECARANQSSEGFVVHFEILTGILALIARDLILRKVPQSCVENIVANLQGFMEEYAKQITKSIK